MRGAKKKLSSLLLRSSEQHISVGWLPPLLPSAFKGDWLKGRAVLGWLCAPRAWERNRRRPDDTFLRGDHLHQDKTTKRIQAAVRERGDDPQAGSAEQRESCAPQRPAGL